MKNTKNCLENQKPENCTECPYNNEFVEGSARIAGPCGQQNCWYSCEVCEYNGLQGKECPYVD